MRRIAAFSILACMGIVALILVGCFFVAMFRDLGWGALLIWLGIPASFIASFIATIWALEEVFPHD